MDMLTEGWTSEIYALSSTEVLKLYKPGFEGVCEIEYTKTRYLQTQTPMAPKVHGLRTEAGRQGYVMERIHAPSLGRETHVSLELMAHTLAETQCAIGGIKVSSLFSPVQERIEQRLRTGRGRLGELADSALEALQAIGHRDHLCHGDFHPGNLLLSQDGPRVIDWNGAGLGPLESDVAKTLILLLHAPPGLALGDAWYAKRREIACLYHRILQHGGQVDEWMLGTWLFVRMTEFLTLPVPAFHNALIPFVSRSTQSKAVDCQELFARD